MKLLIRLILFFSLGLIWFSAYSPVLAYGQQGEARYSPARPSDKLLRQGAGPLFACIEQVPHHSEKRWDKLEAEETENENEDGSESAQDSSQGIDFTTFYTQFLGTLTDGPQAHCGLMQPLITLPGRRHLLLQVFRI